MIFRLVEEEDKSKLNDSETNNIDINWEKAYNQAAPDKKRDMLINKLSKHPKGDISYYVDVVSKSIEMWGAAESKNPMFNFIPAVINSGMKKPQIEYLMTIIDLVASGVIPLKRLEELSRA